jgi:cytochrome c biogenesis protein CcmG, thiol:disulfide interchange protein DsbE
MNVSKIRVWTSVIVGLILVISLGYFIWNVARNEKIAQVGTTVPNIQLPSLSGKTVSLATMHGEPIIIDFFATWCPPCQAEAEEQAKLASAYKGRVQLVLIDRMEGVGAVTLFVQKYRLNAATVLLDYNDEWAPKLGVIGQPETFWIDKAGIIRQHFNSEMSDSQLAALFSRAASSS